MYSRDGRPLRLRRTSNLSKCLTVASVMWIKLRELPPPVRLAIALMLLVLLTLCSGCATQSPPAEWPRNPSPPVVSEPIPQKSYSSKVESFLRRSLEALTGM
jgi:hypothetical protein